MDTNNQIIDNKIFLWKTKISPTDIDIKVDKSSNVDNRLNIKIQLSENYLDKNKLFLHWGLCQDNSGWKAPDKSLWPKNSILFTDNHAVQTPFILDNTKKSLFVNILWPIKNLHKDLCFVLFLPDENKWITKREDNFIIPMINISRQFREHEKRS